jgi:hypothetical protein
MVVSQFSLLKRWKTGRSLVVKSNAIEWAYKGAFEGKLDLNQVSCSSIQVNRKALSVV